MTKVYLPLVLMLITASDVQAWTKYGGDASCKSILTNENDEAFRERAKGWTFGYISALNEIMRQRFKAPPEDELIWQAIKEFCADNSEESRLSVTVRKPISAKQARQKSDYSLINIFVPQEFHMFPYDSSMKRLWGDGVAETFGDLLQNWYESSPQENLN